MLSAMNEDSFWQLINECRPTGADPDSEQLAAALEARLMNGPLPAVVGFAEQLSWALYRLDRKEYGTRVSGDAFLYTRAAVVAAGRDEYEAVLNDPALFLPYADGFIWAELLLYVPGTAYQSLTGREWDRDTRYNYESYSNTEGWAD